MHFEVPKSKTFKEFGGEYLMIVISILTALALEQGLEAIHHRHLAHDAEERIERELRTDTDDVAKVLHHNEQRLRDLMVMRSEMLAAFRAKTSDAEWMSRFENEWHKKVSLSIQSPGLRREAWETAVANQAVTWLERERLERYATAYGNMRDTAVVLNSAMPFLDGPRMKDVFSDVEMGIGNPKEIFRIINEMISAYGSYDGNLKNLYSELQTVVADPGHGAPADSGDSS